MTIFHSKVCGLRSVKKVEVHGIVEELRIKEKEAIISESIALERNIK